MTATEARTKSLDNEYDYISKLIEQQVQQGRLYLHLNYAITYTTSDKLINDFYEVNVRLGRPGSPASTEIKW